MVRMRMRMRMRMPVAVCAVGDKEARRQGGNELHRPVLTSLSLPPCHINKRVR